MALYLRAMGRTFDVVSYLQGSVFRSEDTWIRGTQSKRKGVVHETSGFSVLVIDSNDIDEQIAAAGAILADRSDELAALLRTVSVERIVMDFGLTWNSDAFIRSVVFPPELLKSCGRHNCHIEVSFYNL